MEQSDALSYLVTGKPLSQVKGGEGDMVGAAAQALGSAAGNLLARSIGSKLGVDDVGTVEGRAEHGGVRDLAAIAAADAGLVDVSHRIVAQRIVERLHR